MVSSDASTYRWMSSEIALILFEISLLSNETSVARTFRLTTCSHSVLVNPPEPGAAVLGGLELTGELLGQGDLLLYQLAQSTLALGL